MATGSGPRGRAFIAALLGLAAAVLLIACEGEAKPPPATPVAEVTTAAPTAAPTTAAPTTAPPTFTPAPPTASPTPEGLTGLELVAAATVQIVAKGTFVDPEFGMQQNVAGSGTGFIITADGLVLTNNHVVTGAATLAVHVPGRAGTVNARIIAADECSDMALIDLAGSGYPVLEFAQAAPRVGTRIFVAGYPLGEPEYALVSGIIAKADAPGHSTWASVINVLQHDAAANPGNSGGPVVTEDGKVVGIHYASRQQANQGFAIAVAEILPALEELKKGTNVEWIGINGVAVVSPDGSLSGIWVSSVESGSPADTAGIKAGDLLTELERLVLALDGTKKDYCDILRTKGIESTMEAKVLRLATNEVLVGQINGRPLVVELGAVAVAEPTQATEPELTRTEPPVATEPPTDVTFASVVDDTGRISAEYPDTWTWYTDSVDGVPIINASPDIEKWLSSFAGARGRHNPPYIGLESDERPEADTVGIFITTFDPPTSGDFSDFLASKGEPTNCPFTQATPYDDGLFSGVLFEHACAQGGYYVALAVLRSDDPSVFVWIEVVGISESDIDIINHFLDTFFVEPAA